MTHAAKLRTFLPLAGVAVVLIVASQARAGCLADWFGLSTPTTVTTGYAPGYGYYYAPTTAYRTLYAPVAVTSYRPVTGCNACGAAPVTSYMPVTTYVQRPVLQAYTSYQPVYAPAPACGCASCGCSACGCASCGCSTCGCSAPACSACGGGCASGACGGGCASGACGAALAPAATAPVYSAAPGNPPTLSYMSPISSTPYVPTPVYANVSPTYPVAAAYLTPAYASAPTVTYPAPAYAAPSYGSPTYVVPSPSSTGSMSPTYAMPMLPGSSSVSGGTINRPSTPTLAPPAPSQSSADTAPALPGPVPPAPQPPASSTQQQQQQTPSQQDSASPQGTPSESPKTFETPTTPTPPPTKPIPDNRNPAAPSTSGSHPPIDPNSRTASSMPMLRPGTYQPTPWPFAKTTAALMPVVPDDADGWHAAR